MKISIIFSFIKLEVSYIIAQEVKKELGK